jgi:hypothetical protein
MLLETLAYEEPESQQSVVKPLLHTTEGKTEYITHQKLETWNAIPRFDDLLSMLAHTEPCH